MITSAPRRLPFDVRPFHRETVDSYSSRLLTANFCTAAHRADMSRPFETGRSVETKQAAWMRVLTTRTKRSTLHLEADAHGWLTHANGTPCNHFLNTLPVRQACTLCLHGDRAEQNPHFDNIVCTIHHRWLGLWGTSDTQHQVDDDALAAQKTFAALRRKHLLDPRLYVLLTHALTNDFAPGSSAAAAEPVVFPALVRTARVITADAFAQRFFNPTTGFTSAHSLLESTVRDAAGRDCPETTRALWAYLYATLLALRESVTTDDDFTKLSVTRTHEYPIRVHVANVVVAHRDGLEPVENYLAVTRDTAVTVAQLLAKLARPPRGHTSAQARSFTCEAGHTFDYLPTAATTTGTIEPSTPTCGLCSPRRVRPGVNDLQTMRPTIASQFDVHRNGGLTAADVAISSSTNYWWLCEQGHSHSVSPSKKTLTSYKCPVCSNRIVQPGINCLLTTHPEVAAMWAEEWAERRSPSVLASGSNVLATWRCTNGHRFHARIWELTSKKLGCNICARELTVNTEDRLASTHPIIAARLHLTMNGALTAAHVSHGERREMWWQCERIAEHAYKARLDKISRGQGCSICCSRKLIAGENDLGTVEPLLTIELHPYLNRKEAHEIFPSDHKLWWRCLVGKHDHAQTTQNRRQSNGCPKCEKTNRILNYSATKSQS
ncbi:zinc-ribbon domain-containing protein [Cryobacterium sp. N19]|uniref:zinc-ribbon domain-containing protein n=1 Tax=Cryobacterium sp. N19 TaxID=2048288 RepID=UPI000CE34224|nr:zinc-ribbon domain-containing protein [Cryobacterium sp. N19]